MGRNLQIRGTLQIVELRTLNAEINEICREDIEEVDYQHKSVLKLVQGDTDKEISFADAGIDKARCLMFKSDDPVLVKIDSVASAPINTTFFIHIGEIEKLYLTATIGTTVRILAAK